MASTKDTSRNSKAVQNTAELLEKNTDGQNVTPQVSVAQTGNSLKNIFSLISQFVSVGGDFV